MKRLAILITLMLAAVIALAQTGPDPYRYAVTTTDSEGNVYEHGKYSMPLTIGDVKLTPVGIDGYVSKYDSAGKFQWVEKITTQKYYAVSVQDIECDGFGHVYIAGYGPASGTQFGPLNYTYTSRMFQGYVAKLDAKTGNWLWVKPITSTYSVNLPDIEIDETGNIYLAGSYQHAMVWDDVATPGHGAVDGFIAKIDPDGKMIWWNNLGGKLMDWCANVELDKYGRMYVVGQFSGGNANIGGYTVKNFNSRGNVPDGWVGLVNCSDGEWLWVKTIPFWASDYITHVVTDEYGNGYVAGAFSKYGSYSITLGPSRINSIGGLDAYVAMIDPNGDWIWGKGLGGSGYEWVETMQYELGTISIGGQSNAPVKIGDRTLPAGEWSATFTSAGKFLAAVAR